MADRLGLHIDDYRLIRLLGKGSFGEVYLGEHVEKQTLAAVKMLTLNQENWREFVKEASTASRLKHPYIVSLQTFGISADDIPYLIMDYAPNGTLLQRHPKGTRLPLGTIISYLLPLAEALQYAHDKRVIHQDVKPENVLIGQNGEILLSDFGIAVIAPLERSLSTQKPGGTPPYMAPEQIRGKPQLASDQYALGIMAYEWLCGVRPFQGTLWELFNQHQSHQPPPLREKLPNLPPMVEETILKALAKDPQERFPRILDLATALQEAARVGNPSATLASSRDAAPPEKQAPSQPATPQPGQVPSQLSPKEPQIVTQPVLPPHTIAPPTSPYPPINSTPPLQPIFISSEPPVVRRNLVKWQFILSVGLILVLIASGAFFSPFVMRIISFPHPSALIPPLMTATAIANAEHAYDTGVAKNGIMFGFDSAHTHQNPYEKVINRTNVSRLKLVWSYAWSYATNNYSSPTIANGLVYVGSWDKKLYAFDATCRKVCLPLWSYTTGDSIYSSPTVANGLVYVGSDDDKLYAFDATCHKACQPLWSYPTGNAIFSSSAVANGLVYVGSDDHKLYAFDATCRKNCLPLWSYPTGNEIDSSPAVANGFVYVGSDDDKLYAFDATCRKDCLPLWSYTTGYSIHSSPTVSNGLLYVGSDDDKLYAFDAACYKACQPLWSYPTGNEIDSSPAIANGLVYVGSWDKKLYAFDATCRKNCLPLWSYPTGNAIFSSPTVANGLVYVGSWDKKLYAFDAACHKDCLPLWSYLTGNGISSSPAIANGLVYVGSDDNKLYAFGITAK